LTTFSFTYEKKVKIAQPAPFFRTYSPVSNHTDEAEHLLEMDISKQAIQKMLQQTKKHGACLYARLKAETFSSNSKC